MVLWLLVLILMIPILAIILDSQVGRALASRLENRGLPGGQDTHVLERLAHLESEVDELSKEVMRLEEEGRFLQKLLEERPKPDALPPSDQSRE